MIPTVGQKKALDMFHEGRPGASWMKNLDMLRHSGLEKRETWRGVSASVPMS